MVGRLEEAFSGIGFASCVLVLVFKGGPLCMAFAVDCDSCVKGRSSSSSSTCFMRSSTILGLLIVDDAGRCGKEDAMGAASLSSSESTIRDGIVA